MLLNIAQWKAFRNESFTLPVFSVYVYTRDIQKISSVCEYYRCSAAVTMVRKRAEFLDSLLRHGRNLQKSEQCLRIVLCVYNV